jgi:hypothetical protein
MGVKNKTVSDVFEYLFVRTDELLTSFGKKRKNKAVSADIEKFVVNIAVVYSKMLKEYPELTQAPYDKFKFPSSDRVEKMLIFYYENTTAPNIDLYRTQVLCLHHTIGNFVMALDQLRQERK